MKISIPRIVLMKEKPGVISPNSCWVLIYDCWMYTGDTVFQLTKTVVKNWKSDKYIVGY